LFWEDVEKKLAGSGSKTERMIVFLACLSDAIREKNGLPPVLVGGGAVSYYSDDKYATDDFDILCPVEAETAVEVLREWGFENAAGGSVFSRLEEDLTVHLCGIGEVDEDPVKTGRLNNVFADGKSVRVVSFEDALLDRLKACVHWKHTPSCEQFEGLLEERAASGGSVDTEYMLSCLEREGDGESYGYLRDALPNDADRESGETSDFSGEPGL